MDRFGHYFRFSQTVCKNTVIYISDQIKLFRFEKLITWLKPGVK